MKLKTIAVNRGGQKVLINEDDFDPDGESLWDGGKPSTEWPRSNDGGGKMYGTVEGADSYHRASDSPVETTSTPDPDEWSELAEKLVEAGERKPHPNTKLETLREKVADL